MTYSVEIYSDNRNAEEALAVADEVACSAVQCSLVGVGLAAYF